VLFGEAEPEPSVLARAALNDHQREHKHNPDTAPQVAQTRPPRLTPSQTPLGTVARGQIIGLPFFWRHRWSWSAILDISRGHRGDLALGP